MYYCYTGREEAPWECRQSVRHAFLRSQIKDVNVFFIGGLRGAPFAKTFDRDSSDLGDFRFFFCFLEKNRTSLPCFRRHWFSFACSSYVGYVVRRATLLELYFICTIETSTKIVILFPPPLPLEWFLPFGNRGFEKARDLIGDSSRTTDLKSRCSFHDCVSSASTSPRPRPRSWAFRACSATETIHDQSRPSSPPVSHSACL